MLPVSLYQNGGDLLLAANQKEASPAKKAPSKKRKKPSPAELKKQEELKKYIRRQKLKKAFVLLVVSVILSLIFLITGEKLWLVLHQCYWGLFSYFGVFVPILNLYYAWQLVRKKNLYHFVPRIILFILTITLFAAVFCAFGSVGMELSDYGTELLECFRKGSIGAGTGIIGGLLGIPAAKIFGATGGGIILLGFFLPALYQTGKILFAHVIEKYREPLNEKLVSTVELRRRIREEEQKLRSEQRQQMQEEFIKKQAEKKLAAEQPPPPAPAEGTGFVDLFAAPAQETPPAQNTKEKLVSKFRASPDIFEEEPAPPAVNMDYIGEDIPVFPKNIRVDYKGIPASQENSPPPPPKAKKKKSQPPPPPEPPKELPKVQLSMADIKKYMDGTPGEITYLTPPFTLLEPQPRENEENVSQELKTSAATLVDTLKSFGVQTHITNISRGPSVTRYELQPAAGVKISKITNLSDDIAMNLAATGVRIEAPIPGKSAVGIEVPNKHVSIVKMRSLVESKEFQSAKSKLTVALGVDITGKITLADLSKMPHLLIAGSTGSGKSVCVNAMLISLLYKANPDEVKLMLIDPKVVELGVYNGIPHLLVPVVTDPRKAAGALNWAVNEMLERYKTFAEYNVRDMYSYNRLVDKQNAEAVENETVEEPERTFEEDEMLAQAKADINADDPPKKVHKPEKMPQIVIIIDELADLMMAAPNEVEESICRLAQMARAAGMHLVIATQRPSVDVITGLIKANIPSRIAFAVKAQVDSRTILDTGGAEKLLGKGDMLFSPIGTSKPVRVQGSFVEDSEIERVIDFVKNNKTVEYNTDVMDEIEKNAVLDGKGKDTDTDGDADPMIEQAIECVVEAGQASTSLLQRRLRVGYARAGRLVDEMEQMGIVGPHQGAKPRDVLMTKQQWLERNLAK